LLDEERLRALLDAGLDVIILSIDSLRKDVFENIRVRLDFDEVLENALRFIELKDQIRAGTQIFMRMIKQEENFDEWPDYEAFWKPKLKAHDKLYFHNLFNWGGQLQGVKAADKIFEPNLPCVALWSLMVIFANGDVPLCNVDYNNKYPTGSVVDNFIEELWRPSQMNNHRDLHLRGEKAAISLFENCNVWDEGEITDQSISPDFSEQVTLNS